MTNYVLPGTFDPITFGHLSVIKKFLSIMSNDDKLLIGVSSSPLKKPILNFDTRYEIIEAVLGHEEPFGKNLFVKKIVGNTAEFIYKTSSTCVRGIRNLEDLRYESYWPVSRASEHPIDVFLLIPVFDENSKYISSTFFKNQISDLLLKNNKSYEVVYDKLRKIAPLETINVFYEKYFLDKSSITRGTKEHKVALEVKKIRFSCIVADHNIVDYGQVEFIKSSLHLSDKLIIFVPRIVQHERIEFQKRFDLLTKIINKSIKNRIEIIACEELKSYTDISDLLKAHNVTQIFFEMREYHTRNDTRLKAIFEQMTFLSKINIDLIIILQEKFRDISQPLLFSMGYDDKESYTTKEKSILNNYIPEISYEVLMEFITNN